MRHHFSTAVAALALVAATAVTTGARAQCSDVREGALAFADLPNSTLYISCWPVTYNGSTEIEDLDGNPVNPGDIGIGEQLKATGCLGANGWSYAADRIEVQRHGGGPRAFDESFTLTAIGSSFYQLTAVSPSSIGTTGTNNPTLNLEIGRRYRVDCPDAHPFEVIAKAASFSSDTALATQGPFTAPSEGFAGLDWTEGTNFVEFTLVPGFADLMNGTVAQAPGYRCSFHPSTMRGDVAFRPRATALTWPTGDEAFEMAALDASVDLAFQNWSIVTNDPNNYVASISAAPAAAPNQAAGSTRWLRIVDTHDENSVQDRVYSPAVIVPGGEVPATYSFGMRLNVESTVAGTKGRIISQHFNTGTGQYSSVGGIEYTDTGVNVVILGTGEGNGTGGATITMPLYNYADAGGFAKGSWVPVEFSIDFATNHIHATATGTDGTTTKSAMAPGLALQGSLNLNNFRFCIRNHSTGNTSTASYDNVTLVGTAAPASVQAWESYD